MPLPHHHLCFRKSIMVPASPSCPEKRPLNDCVCVFLFNTLTCRELSVSTFFGLIGNIIVIFTLLEHGDEKLFTVQHISLSYLLKTPAFCGTADFLYYLNQTFPQFESTYYVPSGMLNSVNCHLIHTYFCLQEGCCGAYNHTDYTRFDEWTKPRPDAKVPLSCCKRSSMDTDTPTSTSEFENLDDCLNGNSASINSEVFKIVFRITAFTNYKKQSGQWQCD